MIPKSNSLSRCGTTLILALLLTVATYAQTSPNVYTEMYYHKLRPGHTMAEARAIENEFKKVHQVQADEGFIRGWYMLVLNTTTNPNPEYDYITVKIFTDLGYLDNSYPETALKKGWGSEYQAKTAEVMKRMGEVKQAVKTEVYETIGGAAASSVATNNTPIWSVVYMKVKNGQYQEYIDKVKKLQPYLQEMTNAGNGFMFWGISGLLFPWASEKAYDFASVEHYTSMKAYASTHAQGKLADDANAAFQKTMPGVDRAQFYKELDALREPARHDLFYLMEYAEKAPVTAAKK